MKMEYSNVLTNAFFFLVISFVINTSDATGRYKSCSEGCCPHEYCAYGQICYPSSRCMYGCPDGTCVEEAGGTCQPHPPCSSSLDCGPGHSCSMNFNLGYNVCQYNLDIGSTLCERRRFRRGHHEAEAGWLDQIRKSMARSKKQPDWYEYQSSREAGPLFLGRTSIHHTFNKKRNP